MLLPKALNVAMCSQMLPGWSGWGCHTRASTSCLRQRHGISDGFTSTVNRYWWLPRFTCRETDRRGRRRCELKLFLDVLLPRSMLGGVSDGHLNYREDKACDFIVTLQVISFSSHPQYEAGVRPTQLQSYSHHFESYPEFVCSIDYTAWLVYRSIRGEHHQAKT